MNTKAYSLHFSARVIFFKKILYISYPIILYCALFIFLSHKSFHLGYYIASSMLLIGFIAVQYEELSKLIDLSIKKNDLWKLSVKNDILEYYDADTEKTFQIHLSQIKNLHRNPSELKITLVHTKEKIEIEIPMESALSQIQTLLENLGVKSIFKQDKKTTP